MAHGVIGCSEVQKDSTSLLFSRETVLDFLGHQDDLIYSRSSTSETCLLTWEKGIDDRLDAGINEPLKDLVGDAKQRDWGVAFSIIQRFVRHRNSNYQRTSPNFWNTELAKARREKFAQPGFGDRSSMENKLGAYLVRTRSFAWLQLLEGVSKFSWRELSGQRRAIRCRDLPEFRGLFSHECSCFAVSRLVLPISYQLRSDGIC